MSTTGENAQPRATVTSPAAPAAADGTADRLEWQSELDSALSDLDVKLSHPRRRAGDTAQQPALPEPGRAQITNELLDEIAWRVAQQMRRNQPATVLNEGMVPDAVQPDALAQAPASEPERPRMSSGIALTIRVRRPLFRWRFWRRSRRRQAMMLFSDYRVN
jgi:hypothetical protein